jgi:EAL domain-containing protein (putative c-di-GMP-specific phosphodiesterase class I)
MRLQAPSGLVIRNCGTAVFRSFVKGNRAKGGAQSHRYMENTTEKRGTAQKLIGALRQNQFKLFGQPIVALAPAAGTSNWREVLIRYQEEEDKLLPPGGFIPVLESCQLMHMLDRWVVNRVVRWLLAQPRTDGNGQAPRLSVNLSADSLTLDFLDFAKQQLTAGALPADRLSFEIPEHVAAAHAMAVEGMIEALKPLGCRFALTDYTGEHVSEELLQALGFNFVKIDDRIVRDLDANGTSLERVRSIGLLCRRLGMRTIGTFVERQEILRVLTQLGVDYAQGYGIARPQPLA